jgi:lipoate-protein ligase A
MELFNLGKVPWEESQLMYHALARLGRESLCLVSPANINGELIAEMKALETSMIDDAWLFQKGKQVEGRVVKVRSGLNLVQRMHKAAGGLIRVKFTVEDGKYKGVSISGDFFCFPRDSVDRLAVMLENCSTDNIADVVSGLYQTEEFEIPGVTIDDWSQAFRI